ncbi:Mpo1-like protein, partial [Vibrio sp. 1403]
SMLLFGALWILQFIGHKIEGKKPSFFEDLQFLLIGPIWVFRKH